MKAQLKGFLGSTYTHTKPSNKEFLGLLYEYAKSYDILEKICDIDGIICPISNNVCDVYANVVDILRNLQ